MSGTITVRQHLLGMEPYVLIKLVEDAAGGEILKFDAGGGIADPLEMLGLLAFALAEMLDQSENLPPAAMAVRDALDALMKAIEDREPAEVAADGDR